MDAAEFAKLHYPPEDGGQPGYDRNETARHAFIKGWQIAMSEIHAEDRTVQGVGTGQIHMAEKEWRRITDELSRLRTMESEREHTPVAPMENLLQPEHVRIVHITRELNEALKRADTPFQVALYVQFEEPSKLTRVTNMRVVQSSSGVIPD